MLYHLLDILLAYGRHRYVRISAVIYFLIAGVLTQVPLFNYLGFEFSALMTIPAAFISGFLTIHFCREHLGKPLRRRTWILVLADYIVMNLVLLVIPCVVLLFNAFVVPNCSLSRGLAYYFLLPCITAMFSISLAALLAILFRRARLLFVLTIIAILSQILFITYFQPQVFAYNFVLGYFPGFTYDELPSEIWILLMHREFTLVFAILLFCLFLLLLKTDFRARRFRDRFVGFRLNKNDWRLAGLALICALMLIIGHVQRSALGFEHSAGDVRSALGGMAVSKHCILFFPLDRKADITPVQRLGEAEYHYEVVSSRLSEKLRSDIDIEIYVYPDQQTKRWFIGTSTTITKPWLQQIHITFDDYESAIRHEMVHIVAANFGSPIIQASTRLGLNEGLATAIAGSEDDFTLHELSAGLQREHLLGDIGQLFSGFDFALQSSTYAYTVAGSFNRYLLDRFGIESLKKVFRSGAFPQVYGQPLDTLVADWERFLQTVDASSLTSDAVRARFVQPSIFRKTCARFSAAQLVKARQAFVRKEFGEAEQVYQRLYDETGSIQSLRGLFRVWIYQSRMADVIALVEQLHHNAVSKHDPAIMLMVGDSYWLTGQMDSALAYYRRLSIAHVSSGYDEIALLRKLIVKDPLLSKTLGSYFYPLAEDSVRVRLLDSLNRTSPENLPLQMVHAQDAHRRKKMSVAARLSIPLANQFLEPELKYAATYRAAIALYHTSEYEKAKAFFWNAQNYTELPALAEELRDWIDRCDFIADFTESRQ